MNECTCSPNHSVGKLGHTRSCDAYLDAERAKYVYRGAHGIERGNAVSPDRPLKTSIGELTLRVCGSDRHADGTAHDFNWATYEDDRMSTGVCRCGLREIDRDMRRLP